MTKLKWENPPRDLTHLAPSLNREPEDRDKRVVRIVNVGAGQRFRPLSKDDRIDLSKLSDDKLISMTFRGSADAEKELRRRNRLDSMKAGSMKEIGKALVAKRSAALKRVVRRK